MRVTLIVNPFASSVTHRTRVIIARKLAADHDLTVVETTKGGHAIRLAHGAARAGAEVVVALGGDGTINEVANGLVGNANGVIDSPFPNEGTRAGHTAVVPLPGGSTNVFARSLGFPNDPAEAASMLVAALAGGSIIDAGVGLANGRAFLFHVGAGFDAAVVGRVERRGPLKRYAGHPLFVAATLVTWLRGVDKKNPWFSVNFDGGNFDRGNTPTDRSGGDAQLAIALNTNPYSYLGSRPLDLAPEANLTTPLSVVALRSLSGVRLFAAGLHALRSSSGVAHGTDTKHWTDVDGVTLRGYRPFPCLLYTSPSPRDATLSRMPSSA